MRDLSVPRPPLLADTDWSSTDVALNQAARRHAEHVGRMRDAGALLSRRVREAVHVQRLSVPHVAVVTGLDEQLVRELTRDAA
jgi:hypothetical protein